MRAKCCNYLAKLPYYIFRHSFSFFFFLVSDIKAGGGEKVLSCEAWERMILKASGNLFRVLIVNRNNLKMTREGSHGKVTLCPCFFTSLAVGQSVGVSPLLGLSLPEQQM